MPVRVRPRAPIPTGIGENFTRGSDPPQSPLPYRYSPWQGESPRIDFGAEPNVRLLLELSSGIRTFSEESDPGSEEIAKIHNAVLRAQTIVFLGFAFHPDNMSLITPQQQPKESSGLIDYYATAHGMSKSNQNQIERHLLKLRRGDARDNNYNIADMKCVNLFDEYSKSLEFS